MNGICDDALVVYVDTNVRAVLEVEDELPRRFFELRCDYYRDGNTKRQCLGGLACPRVREAKEANVSQELTFS